jgi:uncharacterized membrane protein YdjX (TVP38/TMEM64 family)
MIRNSNDRIAAMDAPAPAAPRAWWVRLWPVALLAVGFAAYYFSGIGNLISFDQLKAHRVELTSFVAANPAGAVALFILAYAVVVAFSLPVAAVLSVLGGFLFGSVFGAGANVIGATLGAIAVFLAAKTALGGVLRQQAGPFVQRMEAGFKENALSYMLVLRLIPVLPFFIVNIVPAVLGVPLSTFIIGTFFGIIPGAFVFASIGAGLGSVFDRGESFTLAGALTPEIITALVGLALLSLLPVAYKAWRGRTG